MTIQRAGVLKEGHKLRTLKHPDVIEDCVENVALRSVCWIDAMRMAPHSPPPTDVHAVEPTGWGNEALKNAEHD